MTADPFPEVRNRVELDAAPVSNWVECVGCVNHKFTGDPYDQMLWVHQHVKKHPGHIRYRTVKQANFRIAPTGFAVPDDPVDEDPVCGMSGQFPKDPEWLEQFGLARAMGGATVVCSEPPHSCAPDEVVHCAVITDATDRSPATYYWGPGYRPEGLMPAP